MTGKQTAAHHPGRWPAVADVLTLLAIIGVLAAGLILSGRP
jgi:hypothetical protein